MMHGQKNIKLRRYVQRFYTDYDNWWIYKNVVQNNLCPLKNEIYWQN